MKNYKIIETDDGSQTLYSKKYGEACHSTSGAISETKVHYIEGCEILSKDREKVFVLEVGFGVGHGFLETQKVCPNLHFTSFEIDPELVEYVFEQNNMIPTKIDNRYVLKQDQCTLEVYIGDARENIKLLNHRYHAIYQDAFSPKRNPELWTTEWFCELKSIATDDCIMSTYSASSSIRKSMLAAGWKVYKGVKFGPKRSSTRARLSGETDPDILEQLKRSPAIEITDDNYLNYRLEHEKNPHK